MATWIELADLQNKDTFFIFNTHFDHVGIKARVMSAKLLTHAVDSICGHNPVIITGDFNSTEKDAPYTIFKEAGFMDSRIASTTKPVGPLYTFTGFDVKGKPGDRIDYIYTRNTKPVKTYIVLDDSFNGFYPSDHLPVLVGF